MDVFVFGVGRSGTTMMYRLVQQMYLQRLDDNFRSTYEPFIWDRSLTNKLYENVTKIFGKTASLSIEGIYNHLSIPLFLEKASDIKIPDNDFFYHFSNENKNSIPHIAKFIRANGRMSLFRYLNPSAKFILMIRNPVDVLNSVKHKFSFFGDDFYPSDYPRFCHELGDKLIRQPPEATWATRNAEYVYQMNLAAIEFSVSDKNTLIVEYNKYKAEPSESAAEVCEFLELEFDDSIGSEARTSKGPVTPSIALSQGEFDEVLEYGRLHRTMCEEFNLSTPFTINELVCRYEGHCTQPDMNTSYEGLVTNQLRRIIIQKNNEIEQLKGNRDV